MRRLSRSSVGLSRAYHVTVLPVEGPDAFDLLRGREHAVAYTCARGACGTRSCSARTRGVFADVFIGSERRPLVLAEGPDEAELVASLEVARERRGPAASDCPRRCTAECGHPRHRRTRTRGRSSRALLGPSVLGMPYLTLLRRDERALSARGQDGRIRLPAPRRPRSEASEARGASSREVGSGARPRRRWAARRSTCARSRTGTSRCARSARPRSRTAHAHRAPAPVAGRYDAGLRRVPRRCGRAGDRGRERPRDVLHRRRAASTPGSSRAARASRRGRGARGRELSPTLGALGGSALLGARLAHPHVDARRSTPRRARSRVTTRTAAARRQRQPARRSAQALVRDA